MKKRGRYWMAVVLFCFLWHFGHAESVAAKADPQLAMGDHPEVSKVVSEKTQKTILTTEKEFQEKFYEQMSALETEFSFRFDFNKLNMKTIRRIVDRVVDLPEIQPILKEWKYKLSYTKREDCTIQVSVQYHSTKEIEEKVNTYVKKWLEKNITEKMTDTEKVKKIHDFMVQKFKYYAGDKNEKSKGYSIYTPAALIYGEGGVCQAYTALFYKLGTGAGLEVQCLNGNAWNSYYSGPHAWNLVKIGKNWYHLDVTWDDPIPDDPKKIHYDYYLKGDAAIAKSRKWDSKNWPKAVQDFR